jgi:ribosomal protein S18 acetylase RimI-like enzyme
MVSYAPEVTYQKESFLKMINLILANVNHVDDYIRIGLRTTSDFNQVATNPADALNEIMTSTTYMIERDGVIVGFIAYQRKASNHVYISEVQIDPSFQNLGIGSKALSLVLEAVHDAQIIDLYTHPRNPAQGLYRRFGFKSNGEVISNYRGTGQPRMRMMLART